MITGHDIHKYLDFNSKQTCFGVYTGFQEINGYRAPTKVGRSSNALAIQRARSQGGANWWFTSYFILPNRPSTYFVEKEWGKQMSSQRLENCLQKQTELYYFSAEDAADELEGVVTSCGFEIRDIVEEILENRLIEAA